MLKSLLAGVTVLAIAGSSLVYAQQRSADPAATGQPASDHARHRANPDDVAAMTDARIAGLKAGLRLTPEQEKNWPALETAIRDLAKQRADRMKERADRRNESRPVDLIERLRGRADRMSEAATALKRLADASEPLYKSLDDGQKRRLAMLSRDLRGSLRRGPGRH